MAITQPKSLTLARKDSVWIITFQVNAFTPDLISEIHTSLDLIESTLGPSAVVFASAKRIFSGGLDLMRAIQGPVGNRQFAPLGLYCLLAKLMGRLMSFSIPTVVAIEKGCYNGGLLFICACDHRVMSDKSTYIGLREVNMPSALPESGTRVLLAKLSPNTVKDMMLTGRDIGPQEALATQTVDILAPQDQVLTKAVEWAQSLSSLGEKREAYGLLKRQMYGKEAALCAKAAWEYEEMVCSTKFTSKL
jgi:enoyl-CoA hydratase/carnithine racemase